MSSRSVSVVYALYASGRLIVIRATMSFFSYRTSRKLRLLASLESKYRTVDAVISPCLRSTHADLQDHRGGTVSGRTPGEQPVPAILNCQVLDQFDDRSHPGWRLRVTPHERATMPVHALRIEGQLPRDVDVVHRERHVRRRALQLAGLDARAFQREPRRGHGGHRHEALFDARLAVREQLHVDVAVACHGTGALAVADEQHARAPVGGMRLRPERDRPALEHGFESGESGGGRWMHALVARHGGLYLLAAAHFDRTNHVTPQEGGIVGKRLLVLRVTEQGNLLLRRALDAGFARHVLRRLNHRVPGVRIVAEAVEYEVL